MEKNRILEGNISKGIMMFFLPIWFGTFFQQLYNTADAVIVGNYVGKQALAAVGGPTGTIINLLIGFFVGLSSGAGVIISQHYGSHNYEKTSAAIHTSVAIALWGGVALMLIGIPLSPYILKSMGTPSDILEYATVYIRIYFGGAIFNLVYNIGSGILRAMGDSKKPLQFLIVSSIVNIVLDIVFVVIFKMGVMGVGVATVISQIVSAILVIITLMNMPFDRKLYLEHIKLDKAMCKEIFKIGIPAGLQSIMYSLSNIIIQSSVNVFGTDTVAAWTAYGKIDAVLFMTLSSFGITTTTFVSQNFGARNFERMKKCVKTSVILTTGFVLAISIGLYFGSEVFYRIFTQDPQVIKIGQQIMGIMIPFYASYIGIELLSGALRGVGDSIIPTIITVIGICVIRISWILLVVPHNRTLTMVLVSYPMTWVITSLCFIIYYCFGPWYKKAIARLEPIKH